MESFADLLRNPSRSAHARHRNGGSRGGSAHFSSAIRRKDRLPVGNNELSWDFVKDAVTVGDAYRSIVVDLRPDDLPRNAIELAAASDALLVG